MSHLTAFGRGSDMSEILDDFFRVFSLACTRFTTGKKLTMFKESQKSL